MGKRLIARVISPEGWLSPTAFVAMTRSVYVWPPVRFVMVWVVMMWVPAVAVSSETSAGTVQLSVESFHWTLYPVMSDPPSPRLGRSASQSSSLQRGTCQLTLRLP